MERGEEGLKVVSSNSLSRGVLGEVAIDDLSNGAG
jgi:hypothetical protein